MESSFQKKHNHAKRNPLLQGMIQNDNVHGQGLVQKDEFQPRYELEFGLPDIPVKPKLFRFVDTDPLSADNNLYKYEYSEIEMIQEQLGQSNQIYTDYNIGIRPNLVDREIYQFKKQDPSKSAAELRQMMSEKLKYILSDSDAYDPYECQKQLKISKQIKIPSKFIASDKIQRFGGKIADPFKINMQNIEEINQRVFTSEEELKDKQKRQKAINLIQESFQNIKKVKVGIEKPGSNGKVVAKKVYDIFPKFEAASLKTMQVTNDDAHFIEENMPIKIEKDELSQNEQIKMMELQKIYNQNNGQILVPFFDQLENENKYALYRYDHKESMTESLADSVFKEAHQKFDELQIVYQYEHIRDYGLSRQAIDAKNEYIGHLNDSKNVFSYLPIDFQIALLKKKRIIPLNQTQEEEDRINQIYQKQNKKYLTVAPRSFTKKELLSKIQNSYLEIGTDLKVVQEIPKFENKEKIHSIIKSDVQQELEKIFKSRMQKNKQFFEYQQNIQNMEQNKFMKDDDEEMDIVKSDQMSDEDDLFSQIPAKSQNNKYEDKKSKKLKKSKNNQQSSEIDAKEIQKNIIKSESEDDLF